MSDQFPHRGWFERMANNEHGIDEVGSGSPSCPAEQRLQKLEPLLTEISRRAEKEGANDSFLGFTVTIEPELWAAIGDYCF